MLTCKKSSIQAFDRFCLSTDLVLDAKSYGQRMGERKKKMKGEGSGRDGRRGERRKDEG